MLLTLAFCNLFILTIANPFHKYPLVFLLDVGNEELDKTNTEQIKISVPGSSIALRYPAIGEIDTICHVRVSSIDFGTDLKASIIDGGPGAKYVVLVLMGNPKVPYEAVLTIQTVTNTNDDSDDNDSNNSAENFEEGPEKIKFSNQLYGENKYADLAQSNLNEYAYDQDKVLNIGDYKEEKVLEPINSQYYSDGQEHNLRLKDYVGSDKESDEIEIPRIEVHSSDTDNENDDELYPYKEESSLSILDKSFKDFDGFEENAQQEPQANIRDDYGKDFLEHEDPEQIERTFNDEESHYEVDKYKDSNNNYYDNDDRFAVAS